MLTVGSSGDRRAPRILAVGAHCDDIEIGAGGFLARLAAELPQATFRAVVLTSTPTRRDESRAALTELLGQDRCEVSIHALRDSRLPAAFDEVKDILGELGRQSWDLVLTHSRYDAHQDHRLLGELAPTAFRDHTIAQFEIPKWDGDLGASRANAYVPLTAEQLSAKWRLLERHYVSQRGQDWFSEETFTALARLRGMECRAPYAEAFRMEKFVLSIGDGDVS